MGIWIVIAIALLVIVGSVSWLRPSVKEKKQGEWRHQALMAGLKVSLQGLPAEPKESGIRDDIKGASYILYNPAPQKTDTKKWAVVKQDGWMKEDLPEGWSWYKTQQTFDVASLNNILKELPESTLAVERTPQFSRIVWLENGQEFDPAHLKSLLQNVQAIS
ncbi:hypothetical protein [Bermanella sp. R86510]|uniref:hypothetical protein n=1 Tax=unclassified Bermanella TaxID=2627862 RepID=UPI0037CAF778